MKRMTWLTPWLLMGPLLLAGFVLLGAGVWQAAAFALGWAPALGLMEPGIEAFVRIIRDPAIERDFLYSFCFALTVSAGSVLLGCWGAFLLARCRSGAVSAWTRFWAFLSVVLPYGIAALAAGTFFGQSGLLARMAWHLGLIASSAEFPVWIHTAWGPGLWWPYVWKGSGFSMLVLAPLFRRTYQQEEGAARTLGGTPRQLFWSYYLPRHSGTIVFLNSLLYAYIFGAMEVPVWMGALSPQLLPAKLYSLHQQPGLEMLSFRMAFMLMLAGASLMTTVGAAFILWKAYRSGFGWRGWIHWLPRQSGHSLRRHEAALFLYGALMALPLGWLVIYGMTPALRFPSLVPAGGSWALWLSVWHQDPALLAGIGHGVWIAVLTGILASVGGMAAGRVLVRYGWLRHRILLVLLMLPVFLPLSVMTTGVQMAMLRFGIAGGPVAVILCHVLLTTPYCVGLQLFYQKDFGNDPEDMARTLGAGILVRLRRIVLPALSPAILLGFVVSFIISYSEAFSSQILSGGIQVPLGAILSQTIEYGDYERGVRMLMVFFVVNGVLCKAAALMTAKADSQSEYGGTGGDE